MAKQTGLGDNFYIGGYNISGDVGSLGTVSGGNAPLEVTGIDKLALERLGGLRSGTMDFSAFWNDASLAVYPALKDLLTVDRSASYFRGTTIGSPVASMTHKQVNFDPTRGNDGSLTTATQCLSNQFGLEWGLALTAGVRTDTGATNGASIDTAASLSFGAQAYLHYFSFTGTDATVKIQDSADDVSFADIATLTFTQITSGNSSQRLATGNTATIRRYVRAITVTTGGFTSLSFAVSFMKNPIAGQVF